MTITARFPGTCYRCNSAILVGQAINWQRGQRPYHAVVGQCVSAAVVAATTASAAPVSTPVPAVEPVAVAPIVAFLRAASDRGLRSPKARFLSPDGREMRLALATRGQNAGGVFVSVGGQFMATLRADGTVRGSLSPALIAEINAIAEAPAQAAQRYGALTSRCSFCALPLTDSGSVNAGYGPICARRFGLPHEALGTPRVAVVPATPKGVAV